MSSAAVPIRPPKMAPDPAPPTSPRNETGQRRSSDTSLVSLALGVLEASSAFAVFVVWLMLFAAGILVDTRPYREVISASAVAAMDAEAARGTGPSPTDSATVADSATVGLKVVLSAWLVVLLAYLPLNLAWLCAAASTLGAFGSRVNLSTDNQSVRSRDNTSPYVSALLRGFFVYLFMTSGLLLLDETPFSSPSPGQYIRLAGFLSLFSFVISYQPSLFTTLVDSAFQRIQARGRGQGEVRTDKVVHREAIETKKEIVVEQTGEAGKPDNG